MKTIKYIALILFLISCKKQEVEPAKEIKNYTFSVKVTGAQTRIVTLNGSNLTPPFNVKTGDVVYVQYISQVSTPMSYEVRAYIYLDGTLIGSCSGCNEYTNTFNIE
jgi:hypothetical protein